MTISFEVLILLLPNLVWQYIIISQSVYEKNGALCSRSSTEQHFKMSVNVCSDDIFESLNFLLPNLVWWCVIMSQIVSPKDWCAVFKVTVIVKDHVFKIWLSNVLSELWILLQLNLGWWHIIIRWIVCEKIGLLCWGQVKVIRKVKNFSECPSGRYLFTCWTFCNQTWYGGVSRWARMSCKKIGLLSSS